MANNSDWKKKRFEDTLAEMDSKYGKKKEESKSTTTTSNTSSNSGNITHGALAGNNNSATTSSSGLTRKEKNLQRFESTLKDMDTRYDKSASVDETYISAFFEDAQSFLNRAASVVNGLDWKGA